jgi:hypothetical protein
VTAHLQAVEPSGRLIAVDFDRACALEQTLQHNLSLESGQRSTDTVMDAAPERDVTPG